MLPTTLPVSGTNNQAHGLPTLGPAAADRDLVQGEMCFGDLWEIQTAKQPQGKFHWADVITATTNVNDMLRAIGVVPGLSSLVTWLMPKALQDTIVRHAEYATEYTQA
jgi:hypothetical protein